MKKNKITSGGRLLEMVINSYSPVERLGVLSGYEARMPCFVLFGVVLHFVISILPGNQFLVVSLLLSRFKLPS